MRIALLPAGEGRPIDPSIRAELIGALAVADRSLLSMSHSVDVALANDPTGALKLRLAPSASETVSAATTFNEMVRSRVLGSSGQAVGQLDPSLAELAVPVREPGDGRVVPRSGTSGSSSSTDSCSGRDSRG